MMHLMVGGRHLDDAIDDGRCQSEQGSCKTADDDGRSPEAEKVQDPGEETEEGEAENAKEVEHDARHDTQSHTL